MRSTRSDLTRRTSILRKVVVMACLVASLSVIIFATFMAAHERRSAVDELAVDASALAQLARSLCLLEIANENFSGAIATAQSLLDREKQLIQIDLGFGSGENVEVREDSWKSVVFEKAVVEVPTMLEETVLALRELIYPDLVSVSRTENIIGESGLGGMVRVYVEPLAKPTDAAMVRYALTGKVGGLSLALGGFFAFFYARNLTRPVKALQRFAGKVASGKLDTRFELKSDDEFGDLAESLVTMVQNLDQSQKKLMKSMRLEASHREKDVLLREIHHRVKNNMQILTSLLRLQSRRTESLEMKGVLNDSEARIRSMGLLHEKLYQSDSISRIDLKGYLETLVFELQRMNTTHKHPDLRVTAQGIMLGLDSALPCGLIVTELVSNAFKYAFKDEKKPVVVVNVSKQPTGEFSLVVWDNGCGMPDGIDIGTGTSLGLRLVRMLTEQLNGEVSFSAEQGTRFEIRFKESEYKNRY